MESKTFDGRFGICMQCDGRSAPARIELAACRHCVCEDCFNEDTSKEPPVCQVCAHTRSGASDEDAAKYLFGTSSVDVDDCVNCIHGCKIYGSIWNTVINRRLLDVKQRYDFYFQKFLEFGVLYVHIPKTGGASIETALFDIRNRSQHAPLSYWRERFQSGSATNPHNWGNLFKFTVVRHPFHRLVSGYTYWRSGALAGQHVDIPFVYRCRGETNNSNTGNDSNSHDSNSNNSSSIMGSPEINGRMEGKDLTSLDTLPKFVEYLREVNRKDAWDYRDVQGFDGTCPVQFRPQVWFLQQVKGDQPSDSSYGLDFIGRYEDLNGAYDRIVAEIESRKRGSENSSVEGCKAALGTDKDDTVERQELSNSSGESRGSARNVLSIPKKLPHTRASLHSKELPECFQDASFVKAVMEVYQCDFDAFGYSPTVY